MKRYAYRLSAGALILLSVVLITKLLSDHDAEPRTLSPVMPKSRRRWIRSNSLPSPNSSEAASFLHRQNSVDTPAAARISYYPKAGRRRKTRSPFFEDVPIGADNA